MTRKQITYRKFVEIMLLGENPLLRFFNRVRVRMMGWLPPNALDITNPKAILNYYQNRRDKYYNRDLEMNFRLTNRIELFDKETKGEGQ